MLFIGLLAAQIFSSVTSTRYFIGVALIFVAFLMNIFEGKFGYYISFALNFVQFMIYTYEYIMMRNESAPLLLVMTIVNMFVDLLLQYTLSKSQKRSEALRTQNATNAARLSGKNWKTKCSPELPLSLTMSPWEATRY